MVCEPPGVLSSIRQPEQSIGTKPGLYNSTHSASVLAGLARNSLIRRLPTATGVGVAVAVLVGVALGRMVAVAVLFGVALGTAVAGNKTVAVSVALAVRSGGKVFAGSGVNVGAEVAGGA
jgi:uncharacterized protein (DUF2062 family)